MHGFGSFDAAARFRTTHDELRDYFRSWQTTRATVSLAEQRGYDRAGDRERVWHGPRVSRYGMPRPSPK